MLNGIELGSDNISGLIANASNAALIANATIIAMISVLNRDLATRIRNNRQEQFHSLPVSKLPANIRKARYRNLEWQNNWFLLRYQATCFGIIAMVLGLCSITAGIFFHPVPKDITLSENLIVFGAICDGLGVLFLIFEFLAGPVTLKHNAQPELNIDTTFVDLP